MSFASSSTCVYNDVHIACSESQEQQDEAAAANTNDLYQVSEFVHVHNNIIYIYIHMYGEFSHELNISWEKI